MRTSKYTREVLAPIVAVSHSMSEVIRRLGITANGGNHRNISAAVRRAGLDTSHFGTKLTVLLRNVERAQMEELVRNSLSVAQILAKLGLPTEGRPHHDLKRYLSTRNFDTSHFRGSAWSRGETKKTHPGVARFAMTRSLPDSEVFVVNGPMLNGRKATERLLALGWEYRCTICGLRGEWCGKPLVLHIDHINGINNDNRLINLRFLCPNCHSQTPTFCNRAREDNVLGSTWAWYTEPHASVVEWQTLQS